ncbi:MAG: hypothetical protein EB023_02485 [Flavobacteriia bacterium]|nr:hypothetical protein [Flavobacteriia bacterium]
MNRFKRIFFLCLLGWLALSLTPQSYDTSLVSMFMEMRPEFLSNNFINRKDIDLTSVPAGLKEKIPAKGTIVLVDFRLPSDKKRLWVFKDGIAKVHCRVAHGKNSGEENTLHFSNAPKSNKSCIGTFLTGQAYMGEKGLAMRIYGLDKGQNDNAYSRGIVFHSANYVSNAFLLRYGRIGRSHGCFVTEPRHNQRIINLCKNGVRVIAVGHQPVKF